MHSKDFCPVSLQCVFTVHGGQIQVISRSVFSAFDQQSLASGSSDSKASLQFLQFRFFCSPGYPWTQSVPKNDGELLIILPPSSWDCSCVLLVLCDAGEGSQRSPNVSKWSTNWATPPIPFLCLYLPNAAEGDI